MRNVLSRVSGGVRTGLRRVRNGINRIPGVTGGLRAASRGLRRRGFNRLASAASRVSGS